MLVSLLQTLALIKRQNFLLGLYRLGEAKLLSHASDPLVFPSLSLILSVPVLICNAILAVVKRHMLRKIFIQTLFISIPNNLSSSAKAKKWTNTLRLQFSSTLFTALGINCASFFWKHSYPLFLTGAALLDHCSKALEIIQAYILRKLDDISSLLDVF